MACVEWLWYLVNAKAPCADNVFLKSSNHELEGTVKCGLELGRNLGWNLHSPITWFEQH